MHRRHARDRHRPRISRSCADMPSSRRGRAAPTRARRCAPSRRIRPSPGVTPVFVGDDVTDEDGFRAALDLGGYGVKVGPGPTAARYRIAAVEAVRDWLAASLAALECGSEEMTKPASLDLGVTGNCIISALDRSRGARRVELPAAPGRRPGVSCADRRFERGRGARLLVHRARRFRAQRAGIRREHRGPRHAPLQLERIGRRSDRFLPALRAARPDVPAAVARATRAHARRYAAHLHQAPAVLRIRVAAAGDHPWQQSHPVREPRSRAAPDDRRAGELRAVGNAFPARDLGELRAGRG